MLFTIILLILIAVTIFIFAPSRRRRPMHRWRGTAFAHRGLHGDGACENTLAAFEAACRAGLGIELDVQLSRDGAVVVFHDDDLLRLTGDNRRLDAVELEELRGMNLPGGRIPTLEEVLQLVDGQVPLLVELKTGPRNAELCQKTYAQLRAYRGKYLIESFNPLILCWFRRHARGVLRGQLVTEMKGYMPGFGRAVAWLLASLGLNCLARPDFVAYDADADFPVPHIQRTLFRTPMACWTIRTPERFDEAIQAGEMPIFEGFVPDHRPEKRL